ncbi:MAG: VCBS repeat-containing protein, partial [bacterium]|nr:VCBS repeat-containing protein [bacterium]
MIHPNEIRRWLVVVAWFGLLLLISQSTAYGQVLTAASQSLPGTALGSAAWGDYDGDGDPDLLITGLTGPADGCAPLSQIFRNSDFASINAPLIGISMGQAVWGDYDGDGDLDLALAGFTADNEGTVRIYKNENGAFVLDSDQDFVPLRYCALAWGDYDGDGDLDLLVSGMSVGGNPRTILYRNARIDRTRLGSPLGGRPVLREDVPNTGRLINLNQGNMAWGDVDNDGDLDLVLTGYGTGGPRQAQIYLNNPTGTLLQDGRNTDLTPVSNGDLAWGDYDNDGDLDLILSGWNKEWEATLNLYTNSAGILRENTTFSSTRTIGSVAWGDYDNDGDLDLAASGQNSASDRFAFILRNGPPGTFQADNTQNISGLRGGDLAWVDIDNDG